MVIQRICALWGVPIVERQSQLHSLLLGDPMTDQAFDHFMYPLCPGTASTRHSSNSTFHRLLQLLFSAFAFLYNIPSLSATWTSSETQCFRLTLTQSTT